MEKRKRIERRVWAPMTVANPSDRWNAELIVDGFPFKNRYFDTEAEARTWLKKTRADRMDSEVSRWMGKVAGDFLGSGGK